MSIPDILGTTNAYVKPYLTQRASQPGDNEAVERHVVRLYASILGSDPTLTDDEHNSLRKIAADIINSKRSAARSGDTVNAAIVDALSDRITTLVRSIAARLPRE